MMQRHTQVLAVCLVLIGVFSCPASAQTLTEKPTRITETHYDVDFKKASNIFGRAILQVWTFGAWNHLTITQIYTIDDHIVSIRNASGKRVLFMDGLNPGRWEINGSKFQPQTRDYFEQVSSMIQFIVNADHPAGKKEMFAWRKPSDCVPEKDLGVDCKGKAYRAFTFETTGEQQVTFQGNQVQARRLKGFYYELDRPAEAATLGALKYKAVIECLVGRTGDVKGILLEATIEYRIDNSEKFRVVRVIPHQQ